MSAETVQPPDRSAGWSGFHRLYREAAHIACAELRSGHRRLGETWARLDRPGGESVLPEYMRQLEAYVVLSASVEVYCAMAVEALLNFYGVKRLGEEFYVRTLERTSPVPRFELLLATCDGIVLPKGHELLGVLRAIFRRRNQRVHPKSHEINWGDPIPRADAADEAPDIGQRAIDDMERFFNLFSAINENTEAAVQFFRRTV